VLYIAPPADMFSGYMASANFRAHETALAEAPRHCYREPDFRASTGVISLSMRRWRHVSNAVINLLWTSLFLTPVFVYCAHHVPSKWLLVFGIAAILPLGLPRAILQRFRLGSEVEVYRRLGVPFLMWFTQDAPWLMRWGGDQSRRVSLDRKLIAQVIRETWMRERFHLGLLLFCGFCSGQALCQMQLRWCLALIFINTLYNLYPVWLQQYVRLRLSRALVRAVMSQSDSL